MTKEIATIGTFAYNNDGKSEYWEVEGPVAQLPLGFEFGAISGTKEEINSEAKESFIKYANQPEELLLLIPSQCYEKISKYIPNTSPENLTCEFFIKSLSTTSKFDFEFGLQSKTKDLFIEIFIRNGRFSEIYIDI